MNGPAPTDGGAPPQPPIDAVPTSSVRTHRRAAFQTVWLLPLVAALIAGWLVWRNVATEGPSIVITFRTGDGVTAGQTKVRYKAVELGTVRRVRLSQDLSRVEVQVDMLASAQRMLTAGARFWVVRPRFTPGNISGLNTVLSGSYIEMDPGTPSGPLRTRYIGLEDPPAVRSGEPGTSYELTASRIGSLGSGSPIFFRDIPAGEVLNYDFGPHGDGVTIHVFVRAPYDKFVTPATHFWNTSGIAVDVGAQGIQLRVTSLQAALAGGVAFDVSQDSNAKPSPPGTVFRLYDNEAAAKNAGYSRQVKLLTYFQGSVRGLALGAPVELNGIQVGTVTDIHLLFDPYTASSRVAVHMEVQPQRFLSPAKERPGNPLEVARNLVRHGLRAQLATANFLTGQLLVAFEFDPNAPPAEARIEGDEIVLPGTTGGFDTITTNLAAITRKLGALPLELGGAQSRRHAGRHRRGGERGAAAPDTRQSGCGEPAVSVRGAPA